MRDLQAAIRSLGWRTDLAATDAEEAHALAHAARRGGVQVVLRAPTAAEQAHKWHEYIRSAGTWAEAQTRIEEARAAGADFKALLAVQSATTATDDAAPVGAASGQSRQGDR